MALTYAEKAQLHGALALLQSVLGVEVGTATSAPAAGGEIADDADLDGKYGDPIARFRPRDWHGDDFKGCNFSQCSPEFLDQVAASLDYFASRAEKNDEKTSSGKPLAPFNRRDAARARGWAKRIRAGWKAAGVAEQAPLDGALDEGPVVDPFATVSELDDTDIPFAWLLPLVLPVTAAAAAFLSWA